MKLPPQLAETVARLSVPIREFDIPFSGGLVFAPNLIQAGLMVILLFLLVLTLGQLRHRFLGWHIKGILPGISFGFAIALILEGLFIVGGRTILTEFLGWENAPKPLSNALDAGRNQMVGVLGVAEEIPTSNAREVSLTEIEAMVDTLTDAEKEKLLDNMCTPK